MSTKTVLISGGSRGLGASLVEFYLKEGYQVATFSRTKSQFITVLENNPDYQKRFYWCNASLDDIQTLKDCVRAVVKRFGTLQVLINNAALMNEGVLISMQDKDIANIINSNLTGTLQLTKQCLKMMAVANTGSVIFVSSIVGQIGVNGLSIYSATKAAIAGLVNSLTREYGGLGIRINAVAPGYLETQMTAQMSDKKRERIIKKTPLGRLGKTDDIAKAIYFLTSKDAEFITGQILTVDGGYSS